MAEQTTYESEQQTEGILFVDDPTYFIDLIEICWDGARRAQVTHPGSGVTMWHGLGVVGAPLRLGHRVGGRYAHKVRGVTREIDVPDHLIELPPDLNNLVIVSTDRRGKITVATFADLRVVDGAA